MRIWMNTVLSLNIPLENLIGALQRGLGFKVCSISEKELQCFNEKYYWSGRNMWLTTKTISVICCDPNGFCLLFVGLWGCQFCSGSGHAQKQLTKDWADQAIWMRLSDDPCVFCHLPTSTYDLSGFKYDQGIADTSYAFGMITFWDSSSRNLTRNLAI
jgi:hypothetical protein